MRAAVTEKNPYPRERPIWYLMIHRCENKLNHKYPRYGGRGIRVCERWKTFENFLADMGRRPSPDHSIERINNDGNYEPENCRWATRKEQARNMSFNRFIIDTDGERLCLVDFCAKHGLSTWCVQRRMKLGLSGSDLSAPSKNKPSTGLSYDPRRGTWYAYYGSRKNRVHIGTFETKEAAATARQDYIVSLSENP